MNAIALIARREIDQRLRTKSFALFTAGLVAGILAIGVIARFAGDDDVDAFTIAVSEPVPASFEQALTRAGSAIERAVRVVAVAGAPEARAMLEQDDDAPDAAVLTDEGALVFPGAVDQTVQAVVQQAWSVSRIESSLQDAGLSPAQVADALSPEPLTTTTIDTDDGELSGLAVLTGTLTAVLLFISLQTFGQYVLVGVVEEKSSAVVELLLARVRAHQMLAGKVIGIGIVALIQFVAMVAAGMVALAISGNSIPGEVWSAVPMALLWFLLGYALYSTLFALAGSLVSRQEDAQGAAAPILTVLIGAYMVVFVFGYIPDSTASRILSLIPPITPFLMPMRMAAGAAAPWEVALAIALTLLSTVAVTKLAGRIYEQVLLRRGTRITWREAAATLRS